MEERIKKIIIKAGELKNLWNKYQEARKEADENRKTRDKHWNDLQQAKTTVENLNQIIKEKDNRLSTLQGEVSEKDKQLLVKDQTIESLTDQAKKLPDVQKQLEQAEHSRDNCLLAQETQNRMIAQLKNTSYTTAETKVLIREVIRRWLHVTR